MEGLASLRNGGGHSRHILKRMVLATDFFPFPRQGRRRKKSERATFCFCKRIWKKMENLETDSSLGNWPTANVYYLTGQVAGSLSDLRFSHMSKLSVLLHEEQFTKWNSLHKKFITEELSLHQKTTMAMGRIFPPR